MSQTRLYPISTPFLYMSAFATSLPPNNTPYVSLANPASHPTCGCSLQGSGWTALLHATDRGHTETVLALLTAADIDVNIANVSIYPLIPTHVVVGGEVVGGLSLLPLNLTLDLMFYHSLTSKMYSITRGKYSPPDVSDCLFYPY